MDTQVQFLSVDTQYTGTLLAEPSVTLVECGEAFGLLISTSASRPEPGGAALRLERAGST